MPPYDNSSLSGNSTALILADDGVGPASTEVPGPTIFWALLALTLNAMSQNSPTASTVYKYTSTTQGLLTPHLSSPIFCLADSIVDLYKIIFIATHALKCRIKSGPDIDTTRQSRSSKTVIRVTGIRVLLVLFGVVPQAIRLYSMTSIPVTQILATVYLSVSLLRLLQTALLASISENSMGDIPNLLGNRIVEVIYALLFALHFISYIFFWTIIGVVIEIDKESTTIRAAATVLRWTSFTSLAIGLLCAILWTGNVLFTKHRFHQHYRPVYLLVFGGLTGYAGAFLQIPEPAPGTVFHIPFGIFSNAMVRFLPPSLSAVFCTWLLAAAVRAVSRLSYQKEDDGQGQVHANAGSTPTGQIDMIPDALNDASTSAAQQSPTTESSGEEKSLSKHLMIQTAISCAIVLDDPVVYESLRRDAKAMDLDSKCTLVAWVFWQSLLSLPRAISQAILHPADSASVAVTDRGRILLTAIQIGRIFFFFSCHTLVFGICFTRAFFDLGSSVQSIKRFLADLTDWSSAFALFNLITAGLWYAKCYNSTGTTMPQWLSWFG